MPQSTNFNCSVWEIQDTALDGASAVVVFPACGPATVAIYPATGSTDIAEAALEERLDDIRSALTATGVDLAAVNRIENEVVAVLLKTERHIEDTVAGDLNLDRKDFAIKHKGHAAFGLLMALFQGREPDYKDWFRKHILKQVYSLDPVGTTYEEY